MDDKSDEPVKLLTRYWHITDGAGRIEEVSGGGVVGEQPELSPGDSYQYTSGCPLSTPSGIMVGRYTMRNARGETFDVAIPAFSLDLPGGPRKLNCGGSPRGHEGRGIERVGFRAEFTDDLDPAVLYAVGDILGRESVENPADLVGRATALVGNACAVEDAHAMRVEQAVEQPSGADGRIDQFRRLDRAQQCLHLAPAIVRRVLALAIVA